MSNSYPAHRFIRTTMVDGREQPAFAPDLALDHLEAYAPFLHATEQEALAGIAEDTASRVADLGPEGDDDYYGEDAVHACVVHADGTVETPFSKFARAWIFEVHGLADPFVAPGPR